MEQLTNNQLYTRYTCFFKIYQKFLLAIKFKIFYCPENTNSNTKFKK